MAFIGIFDSLNNKYYANYGSPAKCWEAIPAV